MSLPDRAGERQAFRAGQVIFEEGQGGELMYYVLEGTVRITARGHQIDSLQEGSFFGEMSLVEQQPRSATATADTDCVLLVLDRARFLERIAQSPEFAVQIMSVISGRLRKLMAEEIRRQRLEEELKIARQIQMGLMPRQLPTRSGWEFAALCEPARHVGGDFFDFVTMPDAPATVRFVIADVTGKGVPAALFMASSHTTLRAQSLEGHTPAETLQRTNRVLLLEGNSSPLLSAFYAVLDTQSGQLTFANAGHEQPLWWRAAEGRLETLESHDLVLGAFSDTIYGEWTIRMAPGDSLLLITDGVTEARNEAGCFLGESRIRELAARYAGRSARELLEAVVAAVTTFAGSEPPADDCTVVVVKRTASKS